MPQTPCAAGVKRINHTERKSRPVPQAQGVGHNVRRTVRRSRSGVETIGGLNRRDRTWSGLPMIAILIGCQHCGFLLSYDDFDRAGFSKLPEFGRALGNTGFASIFATVSF
jgi:hypothetical protein